MTRDRRILFLGDSFVAGYGDPAGLGWVGRVVAAAHDAGRPLTAYNLGVRRDTSVDVLARWEFEARVRMGAAEASYGVVVGVGTNDMTMQDGRIRVEPGVAVDSLGRLIQTARALGLDVFVIGPPPAGELEHDERVCALSARFAALAREHDVAFVDTATALRATPAWVTEVAAGDGSHPAAGGYAALAGLVLRGGLLAWLD